MSACNNYLSQILQISQIFMEVFDLRIKRSACSALSARHLYFRVYYYLSQISQISQIIFDIICTHTKDLRALRHLRDTNYSAGNSNCEKAVRGVLIHEEKYM